MTAVRYPEEALDPDDDNGTMPANVAELAQSVVGRRIISAENNSIAFVLTLDDGTQVQLLDTDDCCAYTTLKGFLLDPASVDHIVTGVGTTERYEVWHIYADWGDILKLDVGWSPGNPFFYGYGFDIRVVAPAAD